MTTRRLNLLVLGVTLAVFTNLAMFQALIPAQVARSGGSRLEVGLASSLFSMGTLSCELVTAALVTRIAMPWLFAAGALVMGAGAFGYAGAGSSIPLLLALTAVRGGAFGVSVVSSSYLVAAYARPGQRGRALGVYGIAVSAPATFGISLGLVIQQTTGPVPAYLLGAIPTVVAGLGFGLVLRRSPAPAATPPVLRLRALRPVLPVALAVSLVTMTYGGVLSYAGLLLAPAGAGAAPLLFLAFGVVRTVSRPLAGLLSDRVGGPPVVLASTLVLAAGLAFLAATPSDGAAVAAGALFGIGLGGVSNAAYVAMLERSTAPDQALVSATWSASFDGGAAVGGLLLAVIAQSSGLAAVALLLPALGGLAGAVTAVDLVFRSRTRAAG